jgi:hypothetical protein
MNAMSSGGGGGATMGDLANVAAIATPAAVEEKEKEMDLSEDVGAAAAASTISGDAAANGSAPVSAAKGEWSLLFSEMPRTIRGNTTTL